VLYLNTKFPDARLLGLGFSLGANVMTRYVALEGRNCRLSSACVLGCPWDLSQVTRRLEKGFFSRHIYSKGMGRNVVSVIRKNLSNLQKANPKLITPYLPKLLESRSILLREVDEMAIRLIGGPSPPFPFASAWDYYSWASNREIIGQIRTPLLIVNAKDDPIVLESPSMEQDSGYSALILTRGGGHLGWFNGSQKYVKGPQRWVRKPVLEWLRSTAEDLVIPNRTSLEVEEVGGFIREIGRPEIAFRVISTGILIDWQEKNSSSGLLAGL